MLKATHGIVNNYIGKDGIGRRMELLKFEDESYDFNIGTWWDGEDKDPIVISFGFKSAESFNTFASLITEFSLNMGEYRIPATDAGRIYE
jgi:hypothetical protein